MSCCFFFPSFLPSMDLFLFLYIHYVWYYLQLLVLGFASLYLLLLLLFLLCPRTPPPHTRTPNFRSRLDCRTTGRRSVPFFGLSTTTTTTVEKISIPTKTIIIGKHNVCIQAPFYILFTVPGLILLAWVTTATMYEIEVLCLSLVSHEYFPWWGRNV